MFREGASKWIMRNTFDGAFSSFCNPQSFFNCSRHVQMSDGNQITQLSPSFSWISNNTMQQHSIMDDEDTAWWWWFTPIRLHKFSADEFSILGWICIVHLWLRFNGTEFMHAVYFLKWWKMTAHLLKWRPWIFIFHCWLETLIHAFFVGMSKILVSDTVLSCVVTISSTIWDL